MHPRYQLSLTGERQVRVFRLWDLRSSDTPLSDTTSEYSIMDIDTWVRENGLGQYVGYAEWCLKDDAAITAFILKWAK